MPVGVFADLSDSPAFKTKAVELEAATERLATKRVKKLLSAAEKYTASLETQYQSTINFACALDSFCGGTEDEEGLRLGGPTIQRFNHVFKELATFQELLRTQIEIIMCDRLKHTVATFSSDVKDARKALNQRSTEYDACRQKLLGHKTRSLGGLLGGSKSSEQELAATRAACEDARLHLAKTLDAAEAQSRFVFLESIASVVDAHIKHYSHCSTLMNSVGDYVQQTLQLTEALRDDAAVRGSEIEAAIVKHQADFAAATTSQKVVGEDSVPASPAGAPFQMSSSSNLLVETIEQHMNDTKASNGAKITTLKQGWLLKQSRIKSKWHRRYFVLDSTGTLYYYSSKRDKGGKATSGTPHETVNLLTAAVKLYRPLNKDDPVLPFAFDLVSPGREYLLQAESDIEAREWMDALQATVCCLLNKAMDPWNDDVGSTPIKQLGVGVDHGSNNNSSNQGDGRMSPLKEGARRSSSHHQYQHDSPSRDEERRSMTPQPSLSALRMLRAVPGNTYCADCGAINPDWASLNLGSLICIECSGAHRKLGVEFSKVRSLQLDTKVWDPSMIAMFQSLGNKFASSVWNPSADTSSDSDDSSDGSHRPVNTSSLADREQYVRDKYVDKAFIEPSTRDTHALQEMLWSGANSGSIHEVYRAIAWGADIHHSYTTSAAAQLVFEAHVQAGGSQEAELSPKSLGQLTALHAACRSGSLECVELLIQAGSRLEAKDCFGRTCLMYSCIYNGSSEAAKLLIKRGAVDARDIDGYTALQVLQRRESLQDIELVALLSKSTI